MYLRNEFTDYVTDYSVKECLSYMEHGNVNDVFYYAWEHREADNLLTFTEIRRSVMPLITMRGRGKPVFQVEFAPSDTSDQTVIRVTYIGIRLPKLINDSIIIPFPILPVHEYLVDEFWAQKLNVEIAGGKQLHSDLHVHSNELEHRREKHRSMIRWFFLILIGILLHIGALILLLLLLSGRLQ